MSRTPEDRRVLSEADVRAALPPGWRLADGMIRARFATGSFVRGVELVRLVADAAEAADHHPDLDLRYTHVDAALVTHDAGGVTRRDLGLAGEINALAHRLGVRPAADA